MLRLALFKALFSSVAFTALIVTVVAKLDIIIMSFQSLAYYIFSQSFAATLLASTSCATLMYLANNALCDVNSKI